MTICVDNTLVDAASHKTTATTTTIPTPALDEKQMKNNKHPSGGI